MSVRVQVIAAMAEGTRRAPATWERITGALGNAGYTPKGKPGGGAGSAHYNVEALASVLMSSGALNPSEAPEKVAQLENLVALPPNSLMTLLADRETVESLAVVPVGTKLRTYIEGLITSWVWPTNEMLEVLAQNQRLSYIYQLELSSSIPHASLQMHKPGIGWCSSAFGPEKNSDALASNASGFEISAKLTLSLFKIAGDLLRDTLSRQVAAPKSLSPPGSGAEVEATPDKTKPAGTGIHDGLQDEQPAIEQTAPPHKKQSATGKARKQRPAKPEVPQLRVNIPTRKFEENT